MGTKLFILAILFMGAQSWAQSEGFSSAKSYFEGTANQGKVIFKMNFSGRLDGGGAKVESESVLIQLGKTTFGMAFKYNTYYSEIIPLISVPTYSGLRFEIRDRIKVESAGTSWTGRESRDRFLGRTIEIELKNVHADGTHLVSVVNNGLMRDKPWSVEINNEDFKDTLHFNLREDPNHISLGIAEPTCEFDLLNAAKVP